MELSQFGPEMELVALGFQMIVVSSHFQSSGPKMGGWRNESWDSTNIKDNPGGPRIHQAPGRPTSRPWARAKGPAHGLASVASGRGLGESSRSQREVVSKHVGLQPTHLLTRLKLEVPSHPFLIIDKRDRYGTSERKTSDERGDSLSNHDFSRDEPGRMPGSSRSSPPAGVGPRRGPHTPAGVAGAHQTFDWGPGSKHSSGPATDYWIPAGTSTSGRNINNSIIGAGHSSSRTHAISHVPWMSVDPKGVHARPGCAPDGAPTRAREHVRT